MKIRCYGADGKTREYQGCIDCKHYDATPYPEYNGKLAKCRSKSGYYYKIGHKTLAGNCFEAEKGAER